MKETPQSGQQTAQTYVGAKQSCFDLPVLKVHFFVPLKNRYESSLVNEIFLLFIDLPQGFCSCLQISDIHLVSTLECTHCPMILTQQGSSIIIHLMTFPKHMIVTEKKMILTLNEGFVQ